MIQILIYCALQGETISLIVDVGCSRPKDDLKCEELIMPFYNLHKEDMELVVEDSEDEDQAIGRNTIVLSTVKEIEVGFKFGRDH